MKKDPNKLQVDKILNNTLTSIILPFAKIFYQSSDPVVIVTTHSEIVYVNKAWEKLTGYTFAEVKGKNPRILSSGKTPPEIYKKMWRTLLKGKPFTNEEIIDKRKDGTEYQLHSVFYPIRDGNKNLFYVQKQHDITTKAKLENQLNLQSFILKNLSEGVCVASVKDEKIVYANPKLERMFGYKKGELIGKTLMTLNKESQDIYEYKKEIFRCARKYKKYNYEIENVKKNGKIMWCRTFISEFLHVKYGHVWVIVKEDITKEIETRKKREASERRFLMAAEYYPYIFVIFNSNGRIEYTNSLATKITGISAKQMVGKTIEELFPKEISEQISPLLKSTIKTKKPHKSEATVYFPKYGKYIFEYTYTPVLNKRKELEEVVALTIDITQKKALDEMKDRFISMVSHELKSPITSIRAFNQLLTRTTTHPTKPEKIQYITKHIEEQTDKLVLLVNDLLDVGKIQAGKMALQKKRFNLTNLIKKTVIDMQYTIKSHNLKRKGDTSLMVYGDEGRIGQVFINLITNAVKYSPDSNDISITVEKNGDYAEVRVKDFGKGIRKDLQKKIFESFYRVDPNEKVGYEKSLGLGLFIVNEIIRRHKGEIGVKSIVGKGSTFYFRLPLVK